MKNIEWLKEEVWKQDVVMDKGYIYTDDLMSIINEVDEPEVLSQEWIDDHKVARINILRKMTTDDVVSVKDLQNLLVPKHEEVDRAYKDGYEKGKQHTFYKGYLEGLTDKEKEPETVASVLDDFYKSLERMKEVLSMELEELEE